MGRARRGLALLAAMAACGGGAPPSDGLREVTVMLNWTPNNHHAGIYAALERGWYAEEGLDVEVVEPAGGGLAALTGSYILHCRSECIIRQMSRSTTTGSGTHRSRPRGSETLQSAGAFR